MYNRGTTVNNTYKELKMKIVDTNKTGDYLLVQPKKFNPSLRITTKAGSILCEGKRDYVLAKWKTFKNT
jgi:hypothetical protein